MAVRAVSLLTQNGCGRAPKIQRINSSVERNHARSTLQTGRCITDREIDNERIKQLSTFRKLGALVCVSDVDGDTFEQKPLYGITGAGRQGACLAVVRNKLEGASGSKPETSVQRSFWEEASKYTFS